MRVFSQKKVLLTTLDGAGNGKCPSCCGPIKAHGEASEFTCQSCGDRLSIEKNDISALRLTTKKVIGNGISRRIEIVMDANDAHLSCLECGKEYQENRWDNANHCSCGVVTVAEVISYTALQAVLEVPEISDAKGE